MQQNFTDAAEEEKKRTKSQVEGKTHHRDRPTKIALWT